MIKFVIPSKENDEQLSLIKRAAIYCKIYLVANTVQDKLKNKSTGIIYNDLITQLED